MEQFETIGESIFTVNKFFRLYWKEAVKEYGLNTAEAMALLMLFRAEAEAPTHEQLMTALHYDRAVISRTVASLEEKGYLCRLPNPRDNRSRVISLTEQGRAMKPKLIALLQAWMERLLQGIGDPALLAAMLEQLKVNAIACCGQAVESGKKEGKREC